MSNYSSYITSIPIHALPASDISLLPRYTCPYVDVFLSKDVYYETCTRAP